MKDIKCVQKRGNILKFEQLREKLKINDKNDVSSSEIKVIDENSEQYGISKEKLMENAGTAVYEEIVNLNFDFSKAYVLCGTGNNGGDGFVIARHLANNFATFVVLIGNEQKIRTSETQINFNIIKYMEFFGALDYLNILENENVMELIKQIEKELKNENVLIIDSMLGTGVIGTLKNPYSIIVDYLNVLKSKYYENLKILSVDIQTGNLKSDLEVILHKRKFENKNKNFVVKSIGIPRYIENMIGKGDFHLLNERKPDSHKGQNGKVLIIGGSKEYHGAPVFSALAASKFADIVTVASVSKVMNTVKNYPELMPYELNGDYIGYKNVEELLNLSKNYDCTVLGSGISLNSDTKEFVNSYINKINGKVVIDADAIKLIDYENFEFRNNFIFTPHKKEFEYIENYIESSEFKSTVVLKGSTDIVFNSDSIKMNITGNQGMTVGGTGDILCGIIGAIYSCNDAFPSACCGTYINGYCGDMLEKEFGYYYNSTDIIKILPKALKDLLI
ncbi:bifunctional ADP-dependent NAD(P)H-hydrate dehydratase/NAD(P)H-hydrate epimerase [Methanococcus maripaludis]|uniref:Bifunctional NAD(P)H-hydrate repair enzyme n=2 Tax=Methanococcus maripaludis TaxID=39152 RepID=A0A7J9PI40_METMI|nr:bifunctional ADP-dependent NAD(P)H-hydrate dehydratase/NAD(P)H-hydrate epimerase [Methanococcus maripaludis]MBA2862408.1 NAD(P)H-hydrate epimerase [Methanococcus maripaludis]